MACLEHLAKKLPPQKRSAISQCCRWITVNHRKRLPSAASKRSQSKRFDSQSTGKIQQGKVGQRRSDCLLYVKKTVLPRRHGGWVKPASKKETLGRHLKRNLWTCLYMRKSSIETVVRTIIMRRTIGILNVIP